MFREMRRAKRELPKEKCLEILQKGDYGVLSTISDNGYPYGVPINYVYHQSCLYVHCAYEGHKVDNIAHNQKVSFSIVTDYDVIEEKISTKYESVILFGKAKTVEAEDEKKAALMALMQRFFPAVEDTGIDKAWKKTNVIKIEIDHITGKYNS